MKQYFYNYIAFHVHGMARPQVVDREKRLHIRRVAANVKELAIA
jgi:hypothetical protein